MRLVLNLISVRFKADYFKADLVRSVKDAILRETFVPLNRAEFPQAVSAKFKKEDRLYCDFTDRSDADITANIELAKAPMFSMHYARHLIRTHFEQDKRLIVSKTMIGDNIRGDVNILIPPKGGNTEHYKTYLGTTIKVQYSRITDGLEFVITDDGITRVSVKNYGELAHVEDLIGKVVYEGKIYRKQDKDAPFHKDPENAYPILNKELEAALGIPPLAPQTENKYKRYQTFVEKIANWAFFNGSFDDVFEYPLGKQLYQAPDESILDLDSSASDILVGNKTVKNPIDYKFNGPYKSVTQRIKVIYIYQEGSGQTDKDKVAKILDQGISYTAARGNRMIPSMLRTIKKGIAGHVDITFKSLESAVQDVSKELGNINYDPDSVYIAVYVSPIGKTNWGHKHYNTIYAQLKELCLKHRIVLQGITQEHINASNYNLELFFTNIYAAILAKLGGIPWAISPVNSDDMIIGIGAFYSQKKGKNYIGSAFCFDGSYLLKEYDCIHVKERNDLVSKIYQAIDRFAQNKDGVIPKRIIIHCYKRISKDDWRPIEKMLKHEFGESIKIPVIIINIGKNESKDIWGYDTNCPDLMPLSGTHLKVSNDSYLLYNNSKLSQTGWKDDTTGKKYLFPIKLNFDFRNCAEFNKEETIKELITQVYQLSRIYWKTVDQQNLPITILYPSLLAEFLPYFHGENLPNKDFSTKTLWFI